MDSIPPEFNKQTIFLEKIISYVDTKSVTVNETLCSVEHALL